MPPPTGREPTLGEISDDVHEIKSSLNKLIESIERTYVRLDVYQVQHGVIDKRVSAIEDRDKWVARLLVASLLLPIVVGAVLAFVVGQGGP